MPKRRHITADRTCPYCGYPYDRRKVLITEDGVRRVYAHEGDGRFCTGDEISATVQEFRDCYVTVEEHSC